MTHVTQRSIARAASSYIVEAAAAVAICYFILGGANWSPEIWAIFSVVIVAVVVTQVLYRANAMSKEEYRTWDLRFEFLIFTVLLAVGLWQQSLWIVALGLVCSWFWFDDWRTYRKLRRQRPQSDN
jgi:hypothetical protein